MSKIAIIFLFLLLCFEPGDNYMQNLKLELKISKHEFTQGESIPFTVVLKNTGNNSLTLQNFSIRNQSVTLAAKSSKSSMIMGTQMSWRERDGVHVDDPREFKEFEIAPGKSAELEGDAIEWLGELEPEKYELFVTYNSGGNIYVESDVVQINVIPCNAAYHKGVKTSIRLAYAYLKTVWFNQVGDDFEVFLLESSPNYPPNTFRNNKLFTIKDSYKIIPAAYNTDPSPTTHICWLDELYELNVVSISKERVPGKVKNYRLNLKEAELIESPFTDQQGNLHGLLSNNSGKEIIYFRVSTESQIEFHKLIPLKTNLGKLSVMWDRNEIMHLIWNEKKESSIYYSNMILNKKYESPQIKALCKFDSQIASLQLFQTSEQKSEFYSEKISVLTFNNQSLKWQNWAIDIAIPEPKLIEGLSGVATSNFSLHSSNLTVENVPIYLFNYSADDIYYYSSSKQNLEPLISSDGKILKSDSQPEMITTAVFSHKPGVYIRYISDSKEFKYLKIE